MSTMLKTDELSAYDNARLSLQIGDKGYTVAEAEGAMHSYALSCGYELPRNVVVVAVLYYGRPCWLLDIAMRSAILA